MCNTHGTEVEIKFYPRAVAHEGVINLVLSGTLRILMALIKGMASVESYSTPSVPNWRLFKFF